MTKLFDSFPAKLKSKHIKDIIKIKTVCRLFAAFTTPPKQKRFVIVGESEDEFCLLLINTDLNLKMNKPGSIRHPLQIAIAKDCSCEYLIHDSFVDCSRLYIYSKTEITKILSDDHDSYLGEMSYVHWAPVLSTTQNAATIPKKLLKQFNILSIVL